MSCQNCRNLKIKSFTFAELENKWNELFNPEAITPGYYLKFLNESRDRGTSFKKTHLKFMYCAKGLLTRFYILRATRQYSPKKHLEHCADYE